MFERFTNLARTVVVNAQEQSRSLGHDHIGTEHLLLGMLAGEGLAARVLAEAGVTLEGTREVVVARTGAGTFRDSHHIPFDARAKKALEQSLRQALDLGHNYIGTEHILLGLLRDADGLAAQVLAAEGVSFAGLESMVLAELGLPEEPADVPMSARRIRGLRRRRGGQPVSVWPSTWTRGMDDVARLAVAFAAGQPMGTHHMMRALAKSTDTAVARVLDSLGVDRDRLGEAAETVDAAGTTDCAPKSVRVEKTGDAITLRFDEPDVIARLVTLEGDELLSALAEVLGGEPPASDRPDGE